MKTLKISKTETPSWEEQAKKDANYKSRQIQKLFTHNYPFITEIAPVEKWTHVQLGGKNDTIFFHFIEAPKEEVLTEITNLIKKELISGYLQKVNDKLYYWNFKKGIK